MPVMTFKSAVIRYFLSSSGTKTRRLVGEPGEGHYDLAKETLAALGLPVALDTHVYHAMANHGYIRVVEDGDTVYVDAPRPLTRGQKVYLEDLKFMGKSIIINNREFIESRQQTSEYPTSTEVTGLEGLGQG